MSVDRIVNNQVPATDNSRVSTKVKDQDYNISRLDKTVIIENGAGTLPADSGVGDTISLVTGATPVVVKAPAGQDIGGQPQVEVPPYSTAYFGKAGTTSWASSTNANPGGSRQAETQANWFINAATGNDARKGDSPATALKTYAEWQRRVGLLSVLSPAGQVGILKILTDLPASDPVTFVNFLDTGCTFSIQGATKVLLTGTLTSSDDFSPSANKNPEIVVTGVNWSDYIGKVVRCGQSQAYVVSDLGSNRARLSRWMDSVTVGTDLFPGPVEAPGAGTAFQILDYVTVSLGELSVGANGLGFSPNGVPSGLQLLNLHVRGDGASFSPVDLGGDAAGWMSEIIFDGYFQVPSASLTSVVLGNNCYLAPFELHGGELYMPGGAYINQSGDYPFMKLGQAAFLRQHWNTFQGADLQMYGFAELGQAGYFDSFHGLVTMPGSAATWFENDFQGNFGYNPAYGNVVNSFAVVSGSRMTMQQFGVTIPAALPTITSDNGLAVIISDFDKESAWDHSTGTFTSLRSVTWANLAAAIGSGGFNQSTFSAPNFATNQGAAVNPMNATSFGLIGAVFTP